LSEDATEAKETANQNAANQNRSTYEASAITTAPTARTAGGWRISC